MRAVRTRQRSAYGVVPGTVTDSDTGTTADEGVSYAYDDGVSVLSVNVLAGARCENGSGPSHTSE
jgi:hypothetical protein